MSPGAETILVQVDIQANNARLVELTKQINENREALKAATEAGKSGALNAEELATKQVQLGAATKQAKDEIALLTRSNAEQAKANAAAAGSIEQLRAQLALSTKAYNSLSQSERDSSDAGQKLQASNKGLSDQLKVLEKAVGDTRRSVGDYNTGVKDVNVVNGKLAGGFREAIDKGLSPFKAQIEQSSGLLSKFKSGSDLVKEGLSSIKGAGETGSLGLKAVASGIALTGIGLFVIAVSAVVLYFTQTAEGGKVLAQVLGGVGAVVQVLTDSVTSLGRGLANAATNPKEAFKDFLQFLEDQVLNRIKAFGVIVAAIGKGDFKQLSNGILQLNLGVVDGVDKMQALSNKINDAAKAGAALAAEQKKLVVARRELEIEDVKEQSRVAVLIRLSKERGKSATDQLAALKEAGRIEAELTEKNIALQQREADAIRAAIKLKGEGRAADLKADLGAKEKEIAQTLASQNEVNAKIQVRESGFKEKLRADAKSALEKQQSDAEEFRQKKDEDRLHAYEADIAATEDRQKAAAKFLSEEDRGRALQLAREVKLIADKKAADAAAYAADLRSLESNLDSRRLEQETAYAHGKIDKATYEKQVSLIDQAGYGTRLLLAKHYNQDISTAEKAQTRAHNAEVSKQTDAERAASEQRLNMATELGTSLGSIFASTLSETGQTLESFAGKVLILILDTLEKQVLASQAAATATALAEPDSVATFGASGLARAAIMNALITAAFEGSKALISKGTTQGFATGGYVSGAGTGTSDSIPAMLSNGESVMNANTTASYAPLLSYLNQLGGGVGFGSPAFSSNRQIDGGLTARAAGAGLFPSAAEIGAAVAKSVPTSLSVRDINVAQARSASVRLRTTLG